MADYIFDEWKKLMDQFQSSVQKDLEEIHKQKTAVQKMKTEIFQEIHQGKFYRDERRIVISAPEVIIGNVDRSGDLLGGFGRVTVKGNEVSLEGVGSEGQVISRAPSIVQKAVDPGTDGMENVVCEMSRIVSQACDIVLQGSDSKDAFVGIPASAGRGGVHIHADKNLQIDATVSSEERKKTIEDSVKRLSEGIKNMEKQADGFKKSVDNSLKKLKELLDKEEKLNDTDALVGRLNTVDITTLHEDVKMLLPALFDSTLKFIQTVSRLAEANRTKKALETEKDTIKSGDDFKTKTTGASMTLQAESINVATVDGDGNMHTNPEAGISVRTPQMAVAMFDDKGKLAEQSSFSVSAENVLLSTLKSSADGKDRSATGQVTIASKNIDLQSVDYEATEGVMKEKGLAADGKVSITAKNVEVSTANPSNLERDDNGKLTKGEYKAEGDVTVRSKNFTVAALDYEVADGKLKAKTLTAGGSVSIRAEKNSIMAADTEGKATGSISLNAKAVSVKSMDVDKEKLTDSALAKGSTMTLVSEKMYLGAKSKDVKSKKVQVVSEEVGGFADNTLEIQQGDGKAVVQLSGGNASVGGSKSQIYGDTTINGKTEIKGDLKAPKGTFDNLEAKTSFKSQNISDGIAVPGAPGGGSLSAKLKTEDAPKE